MFEEFLKSNAGRAVIGVVIALLAVAIVELNYKLFFKRVLDIFFSLLFIIISSPVMAVGAIISKRREGKVFETSPYLGVKGKIVYIHCFAGIERGIKNLPHILDVFLGRMSIVGVKAMPLADGALLDDDDLSRLSAKPGIFNHLAVSGNAELTYKQIFALDTRYFKRRELFYDIWAVLKSLVAALRGEGASYLGEARCKTYAQTLWERGEITEEDVKNTLLYAKNAEEDFNKGKNFKKQKRL